jgi:hypothetical protein
MFYWLIDLSNTVPGMGMFRTFLNVFRYITFRTGGAMVTGALFVSCSAPGSSTTSGFARAWASRSAATARNRISSPRSARRRWAG